MCILLCPYVPVSVWDAILFFSFRLVFCFFVGASSEMGSAKQGSGSISSKFATARFRCLYLLPS